MEVVSFRPCAPAVLSAIVACTALCGCVRGKYIEGKQKNMLIYVSE
jgi:hypothetical protein